MKTLKYTIFILILISFGDSVYAQELKTRILDNGNTLENISSDNKDTVFIVCGKTDEQLQLQFNGFSGNFAWSVYRGQSKINEGTITASSGTVPLNDLNTSNSGSYELTTHSTLPSNTLIVLTQSHYSPDYDCFTKTNELGYWTVSSSEIIVENSFNTQILGKWTSNSSSVIHINTLTILSKNNASSQVTSPIIKSITNETYLGFSYNVDGANSGYLYIEVAEACDETYTNIFTLRGKKSGSEKLSLNIFAGKTIRIRFRVENSTTTNHKVIIKNIEVKNAEHNIVSITPTGTCTSFDKNPILYATNTDGTTFLWKIRKGGSTIIENLASPNTNSQYTAILAGKYFVFATKNDITSTDSVTIYSTPSAVSITTIVSEICDEYEFSCGSSTGANSYEWSITPSNAGVFSNSKRTTILYISENFSGIVFIKVRAINDCGNGAWSETKQILVKSSYNDLSKPSGDATVCEGTTVNYTTVNYANTTYGWSAIDGSSTLSTSTNYNTDITLPNSSSGLLMLKVKARNYICDDYGTFSETLKVTVNSIPESLTNIQGNNNICTNAVSAQYTISGGKGANEFIWNISNTNAGSIVSNGKIATLYLNKTTNLSSVGIWVTAKNDCGTIESNTINITLNKPIKPEWITCDIEPIYNNTSTIFRTNHIDNVNYIWTVSSGAGIISGTDNATAHWDKQFYGNATVTVSTDGMCGESEKYSKVYIVNLYDFLPTKAEINTIPEGICSLTALNLSCKTISNAESFEWKIEPSGAGVFSNSNSSTTLNPIIGFNNYAYIKVRAVNAHGNGAWSDVKKILIQSSPDNIEILGDINVCEGIAYDYKASNYINTQYNWVVTGACTISTSTTYNQSITFPSACSGTVGIKVQAKSGLCPYGSFSKIFNVKVNGKISSKVFGNSTVCLNETTQYILSGAIDASTYIWEYNKNTGNLIQSSDGKTATMYWNENTTETQTGIWVIMSGGVCDYSQSQTSYITLNKTKASTFISTASASINSNTTTIFKTDKIPGVTYSWTINNNSGTIAGDSIATAYWQNGYYGNTAVSVYTNGICGDSKVYKENFIVNIPVLEAPILPSGTEKVCNWGDNTILSVQKNPNASHYKWFISNPNVADIEWGDNKIELNWKTNQYETDLEIKVQVINKQGVASLYSNSKKIILSACLYENLGRSFPKTTSGELNVVTKEDNIEVQILDSNNLVVKKKNFKKASKVKFDLSNNADGIYTVVYKGDSKMKKEKITLDKSNIFKLAPNPAKDYINISFVKPVSGTIYISPIQGQNILTKEINANNIRINISSLYKGIYIIKFKNYSKKFIVE